jgi:ABC-type multidrug transport system ATPase subunit
LDHARYDKILSIVFQDNSLIPRLTAREHIEFFERLNGRSVEEARERTEQFESMLKLTGVMDNFSENLSGGSKRKLCLAIALAKRPQVLVCDEPCAGIDLEARQLIWKVIAAEAGMTSFINVHSIDEAESMTTRVLVMSQGRVKFFGSPAEMREEFKCGYEITILDDSDMTEIMEGVRSVIPEARVSPERDRTLMLPADLRIGAALAMIRNVNFIVHLDSMEMTIREMIEDDEAQAVDR